MAFARSFHLNWLLALGMAGGVAAAPAAAETFPPRISASYRISFAGVDIGSFHFQSTLGSRGYALQSNAQMSALLGAFKWRGQSQSSGTVKELSPVPAKYGFDYRSNSKQGSVSMLFDGKAVTKYQAVPPQDPHPKLVPLKEQHLKDVLDPLSAVMELTRPQGANPCGRRLAIFDGKQRFDLVMSFRRQQKIVERRPTGLPGFAYVCHVRYVPIAGYKMNKETSEMVANRGIEIALRPVPSANLLVPYQVTIPTSWGTATVVVQRIDIQTQKNGQIALVH